MKCRFYDSVFNLLDYSALTYGRSTGKKVFPCFAPLISSLLYILLYLIMHQPYWLTWCQPGEFQGHQHQYIIIQLTCINSMCTGKIVSVLLTAVADLDGGQGFWGCNPESFSTTILQFSKFLCTLFKCKSQPPLSVDPRSAPVMFS